MEIETLKNCRKQLNKCLSAKHIETDAHTKESLIKTIGEIDRVIEEKDQQLTTDEVLSKVGKILDRLSKIASIFESLK